MTLRDTQESALPTTQKLEFSAAEIGALAHLYRGEVYRSTAWRTRLDSTTNWAVVTTGIALSATFSSAQASPLPMVLVGLIVSVFLLFEARLEHVEVRCHFVCVDVSRLHITGARNFRRMSRKLHDARVRAHAGCEILPNPALPIRPHNARARRRTSTILNISVRP